MIQAALKIFLLGRLGQPGGALRSGAWSASSITALPIAPAPDLHVERQQTALLTVINMAASVVAISHDHYLNIRHGAVASR